MAERYRGPTPEEAIGEAFVPLAWMGKAVWNSPASRTVRETASVTINAKVMSRLSRWYPENWPGKEVVRRTAELSSQKTYG